MNNPQAVTERYVSNLLSNGQNADFLLERIEANPFVKEEVHCGHYFTARVSPVGQYLQGQNGYGPTPSAAVRNALTKLGVTFR